MREVKTPPASSYLGELCALFRIHSHDASKQINVVRLIVDFFRIENDLGELTRFSKALDHLHRHVGTQVHRQSQGRINGFDQITQLFAAFELKTEENSLIH